MLEAMRCPIIESALILAKPTATIKHLVHLFCFQYPDNHQQLRSNFRKDSTTLLE